MGNNTLNGVLHTLSPHLLRVTDILSVFASALLAYYWRFNTTQFQEQYLFITTIGCLLVLVVSSYKAAYGSIRGQYGFGLLGKLLLSWAVAGSVLVAFLVFTKASTEYSRLWLGSWWLLVFAFSVASRVIVYIVLGYLRSIGVDQRLIYVIGDDASSRAVEASFRENTWAGYKVNGFFDINRRDIEELKDGLDIMEREVWICLPLERGALINEILESMSQATVNIRYVPNVQDLRLLNHGLQQVAGLNIVTLNASSMSGLNRLIKRLEDLVLGIVLFILALPVMIVIGIAIKLTSKGPILFKQKRHGVNGREIKVYKFRSMSIHKEQAGMVTQAIKGDPRVTRVGRFIRRTSLDELPQFYNVIQGRMSIVGPRPHALAHNIDFQSRVESYMTRHKVKPGITGWAQVNGLRGETDTLEKMTKRVEFDLYYIDNWSLWFDFKILVMTLATGLNHKNAY